MRGSAVYQVNTIYHASGIKCIGESKHAAKEEARENGAKTFSEIGKEIGIYSYATADAYRAVWRAALQNTKEEFQIKDIEKLTGEHIQAFLEKKIEEGVAKSTFQQYAAALEKLETALNLYAEKKETGNTYDFSKNMEIVRDEAIKEELQKFEGSRAYKDVPALISNIRDEKHQLAAKI
ncbi:MAG: site-specific integrase, partial [Desulfobacterales bacterium]|nr:site-specific integrase [Desulfobacterales bacterium]